MNLIRQIILSFLAIFIIVIIGLLFNLHQSGLIAASYQAIQEEWEEFHHDVEFQEAVDKVVHQLADYKPGAQGKDDSKKMRHIRKAIEAPLHEIRTCAIDLPSSSQDEEEAHVEREATQIKLLRYKVLSFLNDFERIDFLKDGLGHALQKELIKRLLDIKNSSYELQMIHMGGMQEVLEMAKRVPLKVQMQNVIGSGIIVLVIAAASVMLVVLLKRRAEEEAMKEKMHLIELLAQSLAHEIRNPLGVIKSSAALLRDMIKPEYKKEEDLVDFMIEEVERINDLLEQMLNLGGKKTLKKDWEDLSALTQQSIRLLGGEAREKSIRITYTNKSLGEKVLCNKNQIKQMLLNLLINALQASSQGGEIRVVTESNNHKYRISIQDFGKGMDKETARNLFLPFYSTKNRGFGLGMTIVKKIVDDHQGEIRLASELNNGSTIRVQFAKGNHGQRP